MPLDSKMTCLCCDTMVLVDSESWKEMEMPIALCPTCATSVPLSVMKVLYLLRSQVATMRNDILIIQRDIKRLFTAQQDLEEALTQEN